MKNKAASILLRVLGMLMIMVVIATCCPVAIPRLAGYEVYNIVSGSMEPAIGVGSVVYVKSCRPHDMEAGDIPAFYVNGDVIVHRIVRNDIDEKVLFTKGDANAAEDMNPVPYNMVIGRVERVIPQLGNLIVLYTSRQGKVCVLGFLLAGMLLLWLSGRMSPGRRERIENERLLQEALVREGLITPKKSRNKEVVQKEVVQKEVVQKEAVQKEAAQKEVVQKEADDGKLARRYRFFMAAAAVLFVSLVAVIVLIGRILYRYYDENDTYAEASAAYVQVVADTPPVEDTLAENISSPPEEDIICPIQVDFDSLQALNEDIIAWLYCEGTVIDYPVCKCEDDEFYLEHAYDRSPSHSGAIFLEAENFPDFSDTNNILYGHHMKNKTMFATLSYWAEQEYFEQHPYMWLLTPDQNYRIDLFSGYLTSALSDVYTIYQGYGMQLEEYLVKAAESSDFTSDVVIPEAGFSYVVLSTCEYQFENARYVLHGKLVPAGSP